MNELTELVHVPFEDELEGMERANGEPVDVNDPDLVGEILEINAEVDQFSNTAEMAITTDARLAKSIRIVRYYYSPLP